jgi:hypothetical protein
MDTFVVRVWAHTADEEEGAGLRGVVEHVASGRSERFRSTEQLISFLRAPETGPQPGKQVPLRSS